jgi:hypothetical protein
VFQPKAPWLLGSCLRRSDEGWAWQWLLGCAASHLALAIDQAIFALATHSQLRHLFCKSFLKAFAFVALPRDSGREGT